MLFNKHSETKQRFGIRKLTIGVSSVLLSTLFLTVNNGQKVNAATGDTVTNA
ncbi:MAG: YSIRK-type signal peptide-containing protein, partial [Lactobacillus crispatus]|nr:YSIRK-type signal peptide-containing protein [Lactobacillus crispatus]